MADKTLGLGKLLSKSRSIGRSRKGSVGSSSIASDDVASISRGTSGLSRLSHAFHSAVPSQWHESDDSQSVITTRPPEEGEAGQDGESTSLVSYDSEDLEP